MVSSERQSAQIASTLAWLEDTARESKSQIGRCLQQIEQATTQIWELTHRLQRAEEVAQALAAELGVIPRLDENLTALADKIVRTEDRQTALETRLVEVTRQEQIDADRARGELNELFKRIEGWERLTQGWSGRLDVLEESSRRTKESASIVQQRVEDFERYVEAVDQRAARTADALKHMSNEFTVLHAEIEALQKVDTVQGERLQVYAEMIKRVEDEIAAVAQQQDVRREFAEKFELHRTNIRRVEERINALESVDDGLRGRIEEHTRQIALIDARDRAFRDRVGELREELAAYRLHLAEYFAQTQTLAEKQRKQRIEALEREIRELKLNAYRPAPEDG
jgi:chromosome segregation ATPase